MKKKILVIAGGTYVSGAEKVTLDVLEGFKENGHTVHCMVSGWNDGDFIGRIKKLQLPYTAIKLGWYYTTKIWWSLDSLVHYPKAIWDFIRLKKKFKPDIVYTISFRQIVLLYPFFGKNIIYHIHDPNSHSKQSRFFLKLIDNKVKTYIAVSNFIKQDLIKCGLAEYKIEVVHNGVNPVEISIEKKYMQNGILKIGIIGQIIERKGHEDLLMALYLLKNKIRFELNIFGKGTVEYKNKLEALIKQYGLNELVVWRGFIKNPISIYQDLDVLVAPTRTEEPFALVAIEAGAYRIPIIVTKSGGFPESVEDGNTGFVINKSAPKEIAEKLFFLYSNPQLLKTLGENASQKIGIQFNLELTKRKVNQLIN
jgi:glycosyltransferase involved in cell wall biosynthesis